MALARLAELELSADEAVADSHTIPSDEEPDAILASLFRIRDHYDGRVRKAVRLQTEAARIISEELKAADDAQVNEVAKFCARMALREADFLALLTAQQKQFETSAAATTELLHFMADERADRIRKAIAEAERTIERRLQTQRGVLGFYERWVDSLSSTPPDPWPPEDRND